MTFSLSNTGKQRAHRIMWVAALLTVCAWSSADLSARPSKSKKGSEKSPENFLRQHNTYSNISFYFTNRGVLFNNDQSAGLTWPRGSSNAYVFGGGLWFATKKEIQGRRRKMCELGYNPNSGAGWYIEGTADEIQGTKDGSSASTKYISYMSPFWDKNSGKYTNSSTTVPSGAAPWPLWDTSASKTIKHNFYFGDFISDVNLRSPDKLSKDGKPAAPAMLSEEDIVNIYTDADPTNNPEFKPNSGYPFGLDIQEVIYSWSFGRYRDMIFIRHKVTNQSKESLFDCWMAPAFDPDLSTPGNDHNTYVSDTVGAAAARNAHIREPYYSHPSLLNMGYQSSDAENGKEYGVIGFSFLESPVVDPATGNIIANDDSTSLHGYGPNSDFQQHQLGLRTFKKWTIDNDPPTPDLRYDFVSSQNLDPDAGVKGDMRLLFATGPFTLPPGKSVETVVAVCLAQVSTTDKNKNFEALLSQVDFAHQVFGEPDSVMLEDSSMSYTISHFLSPLPPDIPNIKTQALDRAVLITWDSTAERSIDPLSPNGLPFLGYQLWRSSRSDRDSTIRPEGANPNVMLGQWQLYTYKTDSNFVNGRFTGLHYTRVNKTANAIPHSYLDYGDDNHDGVITGNEGLMNGVKYYYYLIAYDEYDSTNRLGPLYTAVVPPKNFVTEIPMKPPFLQQITDLRASNVTGNCGAGGLKNVRLDIVDTGRFYQLFSNDTIEVRFNPRWNEQVPQFINYSGMFTYVDVTDSKGLVNLTYKTMTDAGQASYNTYSGIQMHVPGTLQCDSATEGSFTTDVNVFSPNQVIDQTFKVLADFSYRQLCTPYRLQSVKVTGADPSIVRLSRRTAKPSAPGEVRNLESLDTGATRPSFIGGIGEATYEVTFGDPVTGVYQIPNGGRDKSYSPSVLPIHVRFADNCNTDLIHVGRLDSFNLTREFDARYVSSTATSTAGGQIPKGDDPDVPWVPNPGYYIMDAYHFEDDASNTNFSAAAYLDTVTTGPYYFPLDRTTNTVDGKVHLVVHRLRVGGAEIIFNAPGISALSITGDSLPGTDPHTRDFAPNDKVTIAFTGLAKDVTAPGTEFTIVTPNGPSVSYANASLYKDNVLDQVQVVPNPYIVTHEGQTSTDNAKLYFTRLPPRATIEIYSIDGMLIKTLEHYGYASTTTTSGATVNTTYDFNTLSDRYSTEEWNLLTEGRQRVGSQVLVARVIAKDAQHGDAVVGETTTKFAVIVGGTRQVR